MKETPLEFGGKGKGAKNWDLCNSFLFSSFFSFSEAKKRTVMGTFTRTMGSKDGTSQVFVV